MATSNLYNPTTGNYIENATYQNVPAGYQVVTSNPGASAAPAPVAPAPAAPASGGTSVPGVGVVNNPAAYGYPAPAADTSGTTGSIVSDILSGKVDPNSIEAYISSKTSTGAYGNNAAQAIAQIKQQIAGKAISYGGQTYQYNPNGGVIRTSTQVNNSVTNAAGSTGTTGAIPAPGAATPAPAAAPVAPPVVPGAPAAPVAAPVPVAAPAAPVATPVAPAASQSTYQGASIVDYLNSVGQASDFASRSALAAKMGIPGYTGTAAQNTQLLSTMRSNNGGANVSTAVTAATTPPAGSTTAPGAAPGSTPDDATAGILANATAIAKKFGWTAPDPNQSPLNIATNLFTQGLSAYGLVDLKTHISDITAQQTTLLNQKADEAAVINSNPWLTEGERVVRLGKLDDKYATKLDILTNQQSIAEADYKTGVDQVQWQVGQAMTAYNTAQNANSDIYKEALSLAGNILTAQNAAAKDNKPIEVTAGNTLYDPKTGKPIYTAPSKATSGGLTTPATNDAAVRAGVDVETFKGYPADVQAFFSQRTDEAVQPLKDALTDVAKGKKKATDFNKQMADGDFGTLSPAVQTFLKAQAAEAEKIAPSAGSSKGFFSDIWDAIF